MMVVFFIVSASIGAFGASKIERVDAFLRPDFQVFLNGEKVDAGTVLLYESRSYLPLRRVAELVDAEIIWRDENKGIYINQRYHGQPVPVGKDDERDYARMELNAVSVLHITHLGAERSIVVNRDQQGKQYYRVWDLNLSGINTDGLVKSIDPFTEHLFVEEEELSKVWEPPVSYVYKDVVVAEEHERKAEIIEGFIESIPYMNARARGEEPLPHLGYYYPVTVYAIDVLPDDEYQILTMEEGEYCWYTVKLRENREGIWYQSGVNKIVKERTNYYYRY